MQNTIAIILGVWILILTFVVFWILLSARRLIKDSRKDNLIKILEDILSVEKNNISKLKEQKKEIEGLNNSNLSNFQKIGLVRFNPFEEMGGEHSFSLALLNGVNNGFIFTGLHTRERTRLYLKEVNKGKCKLSLSSEEKKALDKAVVK